MDKKKKIGIIVAIIVVIALPIIIKVNLVNSTKQRVINDVTQRVTSAGLKDVVVTIDGTMAEYDSDRYKVFVDCSNMEELSINEMLALNNAVRGIDNGFVYGYTCNGNSYEIFDRHIYKNGKDYYKDYRNSDSDKSAVERENENYNSLTYCEVTDDDTLGEVWAMAKSFVKDKLKSPKSADFPTYGDSKVSIKNSGSYYKVTGYVDAENSFGAEIRAIFSLVMEKSGTKYTLKECNIYE